MPRIVSVAVIRDLTAQQRDSVAPPAICEDAYNLVIHLFLSGLAGRAQQGQSRRRLKARLIASVGATITTAGALLAARKDAIPRTTWLVVAIGFLRDLLPHGVRAFRDLVPVLA